MQEPRHVVSHSFVYFSQLPLSRNIAADHKDALALAGRVQSTHTIYLPIVWRTPSKLVMGMVLCAALLARTLLVV